MTQTCILELKDICNHCGECDLCDMTPEAKCTNCMGCILGEEESRFLKVDDIKLDDEDGKDRESKNKS